MELPADLGIPRFFPYLDFNTVWLVCQHFFKKFFIYKRGAMNSPLRSLYFHKDLSVEQYALYYSMPSIDKKILFKNNLFSPAFFYP